MNVSRLRATLLGESDIPSGVQEAVATARRRTFHSFAPLAAAHALLNAVVLTLAFWGHEGMPWVMCWCYANAVLVWIRVRDARRPEGSLAPLIEDTRIIGYTLISGAISGATLAALLALGGPEHQLLLGVLVATTLCVGALLHASFPLASFGYAITVAAGASTGMWLGQTPMWLDASLLILAAIIAMQRFAATVQTAEVRRHQARAEMEDATETTRMLLQEFEVHSADWLWTVDAQGRLGRPSQRFIAATGLPADLLDGGNILALFAPESAAQLEALLHQRKPFRDEILRVAIGGREAWWSLSGHPITEGGWRGVCSDITRSRDAEARIAYVTEYDGLTDLPNRAMLVRQLEVAQHASAADMESFALFVIDLDNFKALNDTQGHPAGDAYLKSVAERLRDCIGGEGFLARLGGDEFAILRRDTLAHEAGELADQIVDALLAPVYVNGKEILAGGSVGVAMAPDHGNDPASLMKNAELALYRAKALGRGCARFFEPGMEQDAQVRADLETDLRAALSSEDMSVYFQPLVNTRTHTVAGYETLLRWNRPGHGLVSPAVFISCAEETGIIVPLGEWVIRKAISEAARWREEVPVAINLSPAQMKNPSLLSTVVSALAASQLDPARLEIEIVESILMDETEHNIRTLHALRELGVKIALDDFGTGFSSLAYLRAFPFDKIKIDQRFVRDIDESTGNQAIVRAIISLGRDLGMQVTAEGVENEQQAAVLASLGCTVVQGFLYSRPMPGSEIEKKDAPTTSDPNLHHLRRRA